MHEIKTDSQVALADTKVPENDLSSWLISDLDTESGLSYSDFQGCLYC